MYITIIFRVCCHFPFTGVYIVDSGEIILNIDTRSIDIKYYNKNIMSIDLFSKEEKVK